MDEKLIIGELNALLHTATNMLAVWLKKMLPHITQDWWNDCVLDKLNIGQLEIVSSKNINTLEGLDLARQCKLCAIIGRIVAELCRGKIRSSMIYKSFLNFFSNLIATGRCQMILKNSYHPLKKQI